MRAFLLTFSGLEFREEALLLLVLSIAALVVLSLVFAAYTLALRIQNERRERRWQRLRERWDEPLLVALADPDEAQALHALVEPQYRLHFVRFILEYARRVRGEEREILKDLAQPYLQPIADRTWSRYSEIRTRAVQTLGTLGLPRFSAEVLTALDDESPLVAMVAARSLCRKEHAEYAPAVLRRLSRFEGWSARFLASMLAEIGPDATPALRDTLDDEREAPWVRAVAADALRLLGDFEAGDIAAQVADAAEDRELAASALELLSVVGRPEHAEVIRKRCASPDFVVRSHAVAALGVLGDEEDARRLLAAMADPSPWVAISAAQGLVSAGSKSLLQDLADSDHPRARLAAQVLSEEEDA